MTTQDTPTPDIQLPPMPHDVPYQESVLVAYARAAVQLDRQQRGEPVGYVAQDSIDWITATERSAMANTHVALYKSLRGDACVAIYIAPQPAAPAQCPVDQHMPTAHALLKAANFIEAAADDGVMYGHDEDDFYAVQAWLRSVADLAQPVSSEATEPSDDDLIKLVAGRKLMLGCDPEEWLECARALLSRYGAPQPAEPVNDSGYACADCGAALRAGYTCDQCGSDEAEDAGPVKVSDEEIETLKRMRDDYNPSDGPMSALKALALDTAIHALLARYGAAQPAASVEPEWAYNMIDRFLRNNLDDDNYAEYVAALDALSVDYDAPVAARPSVPDGWKLVPIEPTETMLQATHEAAYVWGSKPWREAEKARWNAMLAAVPTPPASAPIPSNSTELERAWVVIDALTDDRAVLDMPLSDAIAAVVQQAQQDADAMINAARDVLAERRRQVEAEGWTPEHDDVHSNGEMAEAAACYATRSQQDAALSTVHRSFVTTAWPWDPTWWKPSDPRRNLVKAGALILAEIERLDRNAARARQEK